MHLFQQLQLWKALYFEGNLFLLTVAKILCIFLKSGLSISCKDRKHMFANTFFTAIFTLVVRSAVLLHDVSARAGDVSMRIAVFPIC